MPDRPATPHHRRAARSLARGPRPGVDQLPDRPAAIHHHRKVLDPLLARPQPPLPHLRPTRTVEPSRGPAQRARPRPHLHLLGLTNKPGPDAAQLGPASSVTVGPSWVDIATYPPGSSRCIS